MSNDTATRHDGDPERDERLNEAIAQYLRAVEAGNPPARETLLAAHPDLADELSSFLGNREQMERVAGPLRAEAGGDAGAAARLERIRYFGDYELLEEIGGTMLDDPDIDVRLALLKALVRSGLKKAVTFIEQRLDDIEEDASINPDQADRERKALLQALDKLKKGRRKRANPWDP